MGEIVVKYKNQNYAFMQLKGNAEMRGMFPVKYDYEFKVNAVTMEKGDGEYKWVNNAQKFELMSKDTYVVSKQSPFHWMNIMITRGREWTKMEHTRNFFFDKVNKAQMINKMKIEEHNILDGKTWYHIKYDNTAPRTAFLFTFLPYNMDRAWTYEGGREHTANGGFTMTHKITHGENVIQEGEMVFDIKTNDGSKFEMEHLHKMTMTEESPFYGMVFWWTGRYGKTVERKMTVFFDKINKSFLFVPKMSMNTVMTVDGQKTSEFVFDNTQAKKHIKFFYAPDAFTKEYLYTDEWEFVGVSRCKGTTSTLENTTTTERGPGPSPTTKRTGTSSLERSLLRTNLFWMVRDSATSSLTPGPPPTPWSGSASQSHAWSPSPGTLLARMSGPCLPGTHL